MYQADSSTNINEARAEVGFGPRIQSTRKRRGMTQEDLMARMGWQSQSLVSKYENESSEPSLSDFKKMAELLGVSPEWLAFGSEPNRQTVPLLRIARDKISDYDGGQGDELFYGKPSDYEVFIPIRAINAFSTHPLMGWKATISLYTNLLSSFEESPTCIHLFFNEKNGEYQRIRRELESAFS